jgi:Na+-transporting methylmalonyl-CoA/oxaloacetate decarboxylase beta subunit
MESLNALFQGWGHTPRQARPSLLISLLLLWLAIAKLSRCCCCRLASGAVSNIPEAGIALEPRKPACAS